MSMADFFMIDGHVSLEPDDFGTVVVENGSNILQWLYYFYGN